MHPSVKGLPLSEERCSKVTYEMIETLEESVTGRRIIKTVKISNKNQARLSKEKFVSIGFNHIVDKIWFVDGTFNGAYYAYEQIGRNYAGGIGISETRYITERIIDECKKKKMILDFEDKLSFDVIMGSMNLLKNKNFNAKAMITNVPDHADLMRDSLSFGRKHIAWKKGLMYVPKESTGYSHDLNIYFFNELPKGLSIVTDPDEIGELIIKQGIEDTAKISEILPSERNEVLKNIPDLKPDELDEKVRFLVYETIRVDVNNPFAGVIIQRKE